MFTRSLYAAALGVFLCCAGIVQANPGNGRGGPPSGACCVYSDIGVPTCSVGSHNACNRLRGSYRGNNTACTTTNICPARPTGACCTTTAGASTCAVVTAAACHTRHGSYKGNNIACQPDGTCPPRGACCFASGRCSIAIEANCMAVGGDWQAAGSVCSPNPCPQPIRGACCFTHENHAYCFIVTSANCAKGGGVYSGDNIACTATTCPQPIVGACCIPATAAAGLRCTIGSPANCTTLAGVYGGNASTCRSASCPTTCACDYNHDGFLSPADFYQFFNAWLNGNGDYNTSGATDRQDLLDFYSCFQSAPTGCTRAPHHHDGDGDHDND